MSEPPIILAIETATSACSVAICGRNKAIARSQTGNNIHSQVLLKMVSDVLQEAQIQIAQLDAIAVGQGPGSFTGLRIGIGVAQGLAYGAQCPMIGVSSLDALANQADSGHIIAAIDARMGEAYWAEYQKEGAELRRDTELQVSPPSAIRSAGPTEVTLVGNAWSEYQDQFDAELMERASLMATQQFPDAKSLLELAGQSFARGDLIEPAMFAPEYVRDDVAKKASPKKQI